MEKVDPPAAEIMLFNGPLETGVRAVVILDAVYPQGCDLARLAWLDHLVVHTEDIGGPTSLHPDIPQRTGELLVRRRLVEDGVALMGQLHLIETAACDTGIIYRAREEATAFVDSLRSEYGRLLRERARWLAAHLASMPDAELAALIERKIGLWAVEFQGEAKKQGSLF
ncbi:MAG: ABC-three component system middle component 2 [Hyphomonadaceae bacterium]|nr:ABC-three component system middle component 2 [Hyphomonadaceae bacterium]